MRTETKKRMAELRERLPVDDQTLLILRVTRKLNWKEVARVMVDAPDGTEVAEHDLDQEAARLRKRYQLVKEKLRQMALEGGPVEDKR
jgi:RNA polymerase sigma-70 factor (ECF subfamily)